MSNHVDDAIERGLREQTTWHGEAPCLWRRALERAGKGSRRPGVLAVLRLPISGPVAVLVSLAAVIVVVLVVSTPPLGRTRSAARLEISPSAAKLGVDAQVPETVGREGLSGSYSGLPDARVGEKLQMEGGATGGLRGPGALLAPDRQVVRTATVELEANDVRAAFLKAMLLVSEATGEYVQDSSISGSGERERANLTLRVAAARLGEVLNELRELGTVAREQIRGEDVSAQVVDVEARLRNEQRVEAELLDLLQTRENDSLKDILDLRAQIAGVRGRIERLTAQRQRLDRLVSLATVLVIIRASEEQEDDGHAAIWDHFTGSMDQAWRGGLLFLGDTLAWIVRMVVGGLIWWVVLLVAAAAIWRVRRRAAIGKVGRFAEPT